MCDELLWASLKRIRGSQELSGEVVHDLCFVFGTKKVLSALDLLDRRLCACYVARTSGRRFYEMRSESKGSKASYLCFWHFCSCSAFTNGVSSAGKGQGEGDGSGAVVFCKHQLAVLLGEALLNIHHHFIDDEQYSEAIAKFL